MSRAPLCHEPDGCSLASAIPPGLREGVKKYPHLHGYLHELVEEGYPIPDYLEKLSREHRGIREPNIIYPIGEPLYIHVAGLNRGERVRYHPIQPLFVGYSRRLIDAVERALALKINERHNFSSLQEQARILTRLLRRITVINDSLKGFGAFRADGPYPERIFVNRATYEALQYYLLREKVGVGVLEPMIRDPYIEDISCVGLGKVFVEHKIFGSCESTVSFERQEDLDLFITKLSQRIGRPVTYRRPIVDGTLPDGSRINIVFGSDVSIKGTNFTIRKFSDVPISILQLAQWNTLSYLEAAYLWMLLSSGMSIWVSGETASGKTTTLKAICTFIRPDAKIVSVEDTPEVVVPHENWVREVTRESEDPSAQVELFDLLKAALRQRPNYIIVGEIRGKEGSVAFQAMQTGHPVLATFHAASVEKLIQRLTGAPIEIPRTYIDNLNAVVIQSAVRLPQTGRIERRVISINEIVGYDPVEGRFDFVELFSWDASTDGHVFKGFGSSYLLEQRIAVMKGYTGKEVKKIYDELEQRAELLELLSRRGITDYYELWGVLKKVSEMGLAESLQKLRRGDDL